MVYKSISVEITQEHFERSIKGSPREALKELIWNACDADAQNIEVSFGYDGITGAETVSDIYVKDDGHGIPVDCVEEYFGKYGLSRKSIAEKSPAGRIYHGKLGQGRYKAMTAGDLVDWHSVFKAEDGSLRASEIHINSGFRMDISYNEVAEKTDAEHTGTTVHIHGIPDDKIGAISKLADPMEVMPDLLTTFSRPNQALSTRLFCLLQTHEGVKTSALSLDREVCSALVFSMRGRITMPLIPVMRGILISSPNS